jgi:hypothetical protein
MSRRYVDKTRDPRRGTGLKVGQLVAGNHRAAEIEIETRRRFEDHTGCRLPPPTVSVGRMRASELGIENDILRVEKRAKPRGDRLIIGPAIQSPPDAGLVGDEDQRKAGVVEAAERGGGTGNEPDLLGIVDIAGILDDSAVTIDEERRYGSTGMCREPDSMLIHRSLHKGAVDGGAEEMTEKDMDFLDAGGDVGRHYQTMVGKVISGYDTAVSSGQAGGA